MILQLIHKSLQCNVTSRQFTHIESEGGPEKLGELTETFDYEIISEATLFHTEVMV